MYRGGVQNQAEKIRKMPSGRYRYKNLLSSFWTTVSPPDAFSAPFAHSDYRSTGNYYILNSESTLIVIIM